MGALAGIPVGAVRAGEPDGVRGAACRLKRVRVDERRSALAGDLELSPVDRDLAPEEAWHGELRVQLGAAPSCTWAGDVGTAGFDEVYYDPRAKMLLFHGIVDLMDGGADLAWVDARSCATIARTNTGPVREVRASGTCSRHLRVEPGRVIIEASWDGPRRERGDCRGRTVILLSPACRPRGLPAR
jgi:hypothetical protein